MCLIAFLLIREAEERTKKLGRKENKCGTKRWPQETSLEALETLHTHTLIQMQTQSVVYTQARTYSSVELMEKGEGKQDGNGRYEN